MRVSASAIAYEPEWLDIFFSRRKCPYTNGTTTVQIVDRLVNALENCSAALLEVPMNPFYRKAFVEILSPSFLELAETQLAFLSAISIRLDPQKIEELKERMLDSYSKFTTLHTKARFYVNIYHPTKSVSGTSPAPAKQQYDGKYEIHERIVLPGYTYRKFNVDFPILVPAMYDLCLPDKLPNYNEFSSPSQDITAISFLIFCVGQYVDTMKELAKPIPKESKNPDILSVFSLIEMLVKAIIDLTFSWVPLFFKAFLELFKRRPNWCEAKLSFKVSLAVSIAVLFELTPKVAGNYLNTYWVTFTAGILTSENNGALLLRAVSRAIGTATGGVIGYLILTLSTSNFLTIPLSSLWVALMTYLNSTPSFAYFGIVSSLTALIVTVGASTAEGFSVRFCYGAMLGNIHRRNDHLRR
jgi:hypothetical protein